MNEQTPLVGISQQRKTRISEKWPRIGGCIFVSVAVAVACFVPYHTRAVNQYDILGLGLSHSVANQLRALNLDGQVYFPSDEAQFVKAATVWNKLALLLSPPSAVVEVESERDVQRAVQLLVSLDIPFTIKSGGHNKAAYSFPQSGGVMLSVSKLNSIQIEELPDDSDIARVGPAIQSPQLLTQTLPRGFGAILDICPTVALSGFALNGGYGFLSRKHGLGAENILSSRIVLDSGEVMVVANRTLHSDLLWALQGAGGGRFGVVAELTY